MKKLLEKWVKFSTLGCYIGRQLKDIDTLLLLKQCPPHDFTHAPRSIKRHRSYWKASEFRNFLYYSLPLPVDILPPLYFHHYGLSVCAMHILLQARVSGTQIQTAQSMLDDFYVLLPELYGNQTCVPRYASSLTHGTLCEALGPSLDSFCFCI